MERSSSSAKKESSKGSCKKKHRHSLTGGKSSKESRRRHSLVLPLGLDFNYESMEDELTCPVCLELYADPLMLPCTHNICKKCLHDISNSKKCRATNELECPSCREVIAMESLSSLPRNLALENIVIRYSEERSKSIRKSLSLESPVSDLLMSPASDISDLSEFPTTSKTHCELCETVTSAMAAWYCVQCEVAYCHACFAKYHPKKGSLARHKVRQPSETDEEKKPVHCKDHATELATIFCDQCKVLICSLCVCDGDGRHGGHKVLSPDTACKKIKESASHSQEQTKALLTVLAEQKCKVEGLQEQVKDQYQQSCSFVEHQYKRLIEDLTQALTLEKERVLLNIQDAKRKSLAQMSSYLSENEACCYHLNDIVILCQQVESDNCVQETLAQAPQMDVINKKFTKVSHETDVLSKTYDKVLKDKSAQSAYHSALEDFRSNSLSTLRMLMAEELEHCDSIIPYIRAPTSPGKADLTPRIQNKYLITWGFSSSSFTAENIKNNSSWTLTIERNSGHWGSLNTGYLFGVGVSSESLNVKDLVGMGGKSHGIVCDAGSLFYSHNGNKEHLLTVESLPMVITLAASLDNEDNVVLLYKLESCGNGASLMGRKLIKDAALRNSLHPVFTVSQRVKLLFHTFV